MAKKSRFAEKLDRALWETARGTALITATRAALEEIAKALERRFATGKAHGKLQFRVIPSFQAAVGLRVDVVAKISHFNFQEVLFRACIPPQGYPVELDLNGEQPVLCADTEELEDKIVEFISRPGVNDRAIQYGCLV